MSEQDLYPQSCPFCIISNAYLSPVSSFTRSSTSSKEQLLSYVPASPDPYAIDPQCQLILAAPDALAFLDIMPMTAGHVLLTTRAHRVRIGDVPVDESKELGFWLPLVCAATMRAMGATDWNVVQNNGTSQKRSKKVDTKRK
jgi:diadenosine tetraphosphate (Ap4A) HIT family hydrolase